MTSYAPPTVRMKPRPTPRSRPQVKPENAPDCAVVSCTRFGTSTHPVTTLVSPRTNLRIEPPKLKASDQPAPPEALPPEPAPANAAKEPASAATAALVPAVRETSNVSTRWLSEATCASKSARSLSLTAPVNRQPLIT